jgi:hypothetical protein
MDVALETSLVSHCFTSNGIRSNSGEIQQMQLFHNFAMQLKYYVATRLNTHDGVELDFLPLKLKSRLAPWVLS